MARIALCQDVMMEYMGFMSISAVLKEAGHTVELFIDDQIDEERFVAQLARYQPDVVGFSILTPTVPWALRIGRRVRTMMGALTVYGNVHAILNPSIIDDPAVDIVCRGEGEHPMRELAGCIDAGASFARIPSFWVKTAEGIVRNAPPREVLDLEALPLADRALYDKYPYFRSSKIVRIAAGRGCPFRCSFCANPQLVDHYSPKYIRKRRPELVIRELEQRIRERRIKHVYFTDEVLWLKNDWLRELLVLYRERIGLPFTANFRFGPGITEDDIRLMAEAGAQDLTVAPESGDEEQRRELLNKFVRDEAILKVGRWLTKYKINYVSSAFFGLPGDTVQDHVARLDFYRRLRPTYLWTTFFQPYPGLPLTGHESIRAHLPADGKFEPTFHHDMCLNLPDRRRLVNLKKVYFLCMLSPKLTPLLVWLTKFRIPLLFDLLFLTHFAYYVFVFERTSLRQFLHHLRIFGINPLLRKTRLLPSVERVIGRQAHRSRAGARARRGGTVKRSRRRRQSLSVANSPCVSPRTRFDPPLGRTDP